MSSDGITEDGLGWDGLVPSKQERREIEAEREYRAAFKALQNFAKEYQAWRNAPLKGSGHAAFIEQLDKQCAAALVLAA